jgi:hypothetical protein
VAPRAGRIWHLNIRLVVNNKNKERMELLWPCWDIAATDLCIGVYAVSIQSGDRTAVLKTPAAIRLILRPSTPLGHCALSVRGLLLVPILTFPSLHRS